MTFERILVPIDLSDRNDRVLDTALALARGGPARVTLLHVIHRVAGLPLAELRSFYARIEKTARTRLDRAATRFANAGLRVRTEVLVGEPTREIVRAATRRRADLIVMGSHRVNPTRPATGLGTTRDSPPGPGRRPPRSRDYPGGRRSASGSPTRRAISARTRSRRRTIAGQP